MNQNVLNYSMFGIIRVRNWTFDSAIHSSRIILRHKCSLSIVYKNFEIDNGEKSGKHSEITITLKRRSRLKKILST